MVPILLLVFGVCILLAFVYSVLRPRILAKEGFADVAEATVATAAAAATTKPDTGTTQTTCDAIPLSDFNKELVLSQIPPDIQYAISSYSVGGAQPQYLGQIQKAFAAGSTTTQMAMSALLGRYLAFNGGSAAIPGPGYANTSPGNYVAQLLGAKDLLTLKTVDTTSPIYPSFKAATTVAMCPKLNKGWVTTADF